MSEPWLVVVLLVGVIALTPLAGAVRVPPPVLLTIFGGVVGVLPGSTPLELNPDLILPVVLPPLLFAATQRTTSTEFREQAAAVLGLAVGLTVSTAAVVAVVAHATGLEWGPAWVLGAIVSPPDPVAATAVARRLRLPPRLVTILEGEGMFNDATALVMYKVAVAVVVGSTFSYARTGVEFVLAVSLGTVMGLVLGLVTKWLLALVRDAHTETTITVVVPFVAYLGAERLEGSGVLAVLALGLYLRNVGHEATTSRGWLLGRSVWSYADFLITSLAFAVLGYELSTVLAEVPRTDEIAPVAVPVVLTVIVFRFVWVFPVTWLARGHRRRRDELMPIGWRETTVVAWSGMRGVVTVATALALPMVVDDGGAFADRYLLIVSALLCVLVTLVLQGLTLAPLTARLGVSSSGEEESEVTELRTRAARAALDYLRDATGDGGVEEEVRRAVTLQYEGYLEAQHAMEDARRLEVEDGSPADDLGRLLRQATDVERSLVLDARRRGEVSAAAADEVLQDIEARVLRDLD